MNGERVFDARELDEPILGDDYPIYADYWYVADGKPIRSDWHGITAREFRSREGVTELRLCDIYGRAKAKALGTPQSRTEGGASRADLGSSRPVPGVKSDGFRKSEGSGG